VSPSGVAWFETLDQAREVIGAYVIHYHHRPQRRLDCPRRSKSRRPGPMDKTT
jgi:hypothetical protein